MNENYIEKSLPLIKQAIAEDLGSGDITTNVIISDTKFCTAKLIAKSEGIIAGIEVSRKVFDLINQSSVQWEIYFNDGSAVHTGDIIAEISGTYRTILSGERTALNFLQRLSGVATYTNLFVQKLAGANT